MRDAHRGQRLELEERMPAPRHVGGQRGHEVHDRHQDRAERGEQRQGISAAKAPERIGPPVETELPRCGVAVRRDQIVPVLCDEPDARECRERRREVVVDAVEDSSRREHEQDGGAQVPLVQPEPGQVQTSSERVPLDADESSGRPLHRRVHRDLIGTEGGRA